MTATELTALIGGIGALLGGGGLFPFLMSRRRGSDVTLQSVANMLKNDRDQLITRLDEQAQHHEQQMGALRQSHARQIADVQAQWAKKYETAQERIRQLEVQVDSLYRQMYQRPSQ